MTPTPSSLSLYLYSQKIPNDAGRSSAVVVVVTKPSSINPSCADDSVNPPSVDVATKLQLDPAAISSTKDTADRRMADRVRRVCGNTIQANCWSCTTNQEEVGQQCCVFVIGDNCRRHQGWRPQQRRISYDSSSLISIGIECKIDIYSIVPVSKLYHPNPNQDKLPDMPHSKGRGPQSWVPAPSSRQIQKEQTLEE